MQAIFIILTDTDYLQDLLTKLSENDIHGTVMPTVSIKHALLSSSVDAAPIFGTISKIVNYDYDSKPTILIVEKEVERIEKIKNIVKDVTNGLVGKGIMFSLPTLFVEGLSD